MSAQQLLDRLTAVRQTGPGRWIAKCPAHEDRGPSLSIGELEDGTGLVHDFAGCGAVDVVGAVGLTLSDLFPERPTDHRRRPTRAWVDARDALACLAYEGEVLAVAAQNWIDRSEFSIADAHRTSLAAGRVRSAWDLVNGRR